ncbi:TPA: DUF2726 domain-containing protein [Vibrio alginolyticus]
MDILNMVEIISILLIACIIFAFAKNNKMKNKQTSSAKRGMTSDEKLEVKPIQPQTVPHKKHDYLSSKSEREFYEVLRNLLPSECIIHCQVSMMALVQPVNFKDNSKTWAKRVDFVITDKNTKVIAVIELDDSSHRQKKRQERDLYVNEAFAGHHKLLRFEAMGSYDPISIASVIEREVGLKCNISEPVPQYG